MTENMFLKRYLDGECEQVWEELMQLPESLENLEMASEVAVEFVDRASEILVNLKDAFEELGYAFRNPKAVITKPDNNIEDLFKKCESKYGRLPIILKAWYRKFGSIDFRQDPIQEEEHEALAHLGHRIPLFFMPFSDCVQYIGEWNWGDGRVDKHLPTGHCCTNNNAVGFCFPSHFFDDEFDSDIIYDDDTIGSFGASVRKILKRGGLHGYWQGVLDGRIDLFSFWERSCDIKKILPILKQHSRPL